MRVTPPSLLLLPWILFALTAGLAAPAAAEEGRWESIGPEGGPISALTVAPGAARRTVYAGTDSGRLFRSEDAGATWTELADLRPSPVADLEVDPRDPFTVYAAACATAAGLEDIGGLFKTVDGGATWERLAGLAPCRVRDVAIDPRNPDRLLAATDVGLYQSDDGGASWRVHRGRPGRGAVRAVVFDPTAPGTVYLLHAQAGFLKSTTGGAGWALQNTGLPADRGKLAGLAVSPRLPKTLYIRTTAAGVAPVYRSLNGGQSWAAASSGLGGRTVNDLEVAASGAAHAATAVGVFRSTDRGRTWTAPAPGAAFAFARVLAVPDAPAAVVYAGSTRAVFKSADAGRSWQESSRGMRANAVAQIAVAPSDEAILYARTGYGVLTSVDGGATWRDAGRGLDGPPATLAVHPDDPRTAFAGGFPGTFWKTTDAGLTWRQLAEPTVCLDPVALKVDPLSPQSLYSVGRGLRCFGSDLIPFCSGVRSTDGGASWSCMDALPREGVRHLAVAPGSPSTLYAGLSGNFPTAVFQSLNAGQTWNGLEVPGPVLSIAVSPADPRTILVLTLNGLHKSTDNGVTWTFLPPVGRPAGVIYHDLIFAPSDASRLHAVLDAGEDAVYRSTDGGVSWSQVSRQGLPDGWRGTIDSLDVSPTDPRTLYAATPSGVFKVTLSD